jgi:hypothetical protein
MFLLQNLRVRNASTIFLALRLRIAAHYAKHKNLGRVFMPNARTNTRAAAIDALN